VRLIFEEFFLFQSASCCANMPRARSPNRERIRVDDRIREAARAILPFKLTDGQKGALKEIVDGCSGPRR
jgi:RecG-like helicase